MTNLNPRNGELHIKIVYAGPGRSGKTTNLEFLYNKMHHSEKSELVTINTYGERTLFFDFFPINIGKIMGYDVKVQLYSGPGQCKYNTISRLVLKNVDGTIFVADSMTNRREKNIASMEKLQENLTLHNRNINDVPMVLQYNKRDLEKFGIPLLSIEDMENDLNSELKVTTFEASALLGINVVSSLKKIISLTAKLTEAKLLKRRPAHLKCINRN